MRYKTSQKILIDKRKLETLKRLNCPREILIDLILEDKLTLTGDSLIDDNLESLLEIKEFDNWGGSRKGAGRPNKIQDENQVEIQDEIQDGNQDAFQVGDKDKDLDKDTIFSTNKRVVKLNKSTLYLKEKEKENLTKEKESLNLSEWYGEYANVHLTKAQYGKLGFIIGDTKALNEIIEALSENIAQKKQKAPPYDEKFPDMHFVILKKYWEYRKVNPQKFKPQSQEKTTEQIVEEVRKRFEKYATE